jgi:hypothetical protein
MNCLFRRSLARPISKQRHVCQGWELRKYQRHESFQWMAIGIMLHAKTTVNQKEEALSGSNAQESPMAAVIVIVRYEKLQTAEG